jgi:hypothetical protein
MMRQGRRGMKMESVIESARKTASGKPIWRLSKQGGFESNF